MKAIFEKVNGFVKELDWYFLGVVGLGVAGQIVLGDKVGLDVIGNLQGIVDGKLLGRCKSCRFNYLARSSWSYR